MRMLTCILIFQLCPGYSDIAIEALRHLNLSTVEFWSCRFHYNNTFSRALVLFRLLGVS